MSTSSASLPVTATPVDTAGSRHHPRIALAIIMASQLMVALASTVVNLSLLGIRASLHFSATGLSWVPNSYLLAFGGLLLLGGRAGDILGRRRVFVAGVALFACAALLGGLAPSAPWLLLALALQGAGAALAVPGSLSLIATTFPEGAARNRALGIYSTVAGIGLAVGLILGGLLSTVSWRWALLINVPVGIAAAVLAPRFIQESERHSGRFDVTGALTSTAGMAALVYAFVHVSADGWGDRVTLSTLAAGLVLLAAFVTVELRARQPVVPLRLLANRNRASAYLNTLLVTEDMSGLFFFLSQFVQVILGFSVLRAGVAFLPLALAQFAFAIAAPRLVARFSARPVVVCGVLLLLGSAAWLTRISVSTGYLSGILGPLLLAGAGVGLCIMPLNSVILSGVPRPDYGAASGLQQAMLRVGGSLGLAVLVNVSATASRNAAEHPSAAIPAGAAKGYFMTRGMAGAFAAAVVFAAGALAVALFALRAARTRSAAGVGVEGKG